MTDWHELTVLHEGEIAGRLRRDTLYGVVFEYSEEWLRRRPEEPLESILPTTRLRHTGEVVEQWLWRLLAGVSGLTTTWAKEHGVATDDVFEILVIKGEFIDGGTKFVRPDRVEQFMLGP